MKTNKKVKSKKQSVKPTLKVLQKEVAFLHGVIDILGKADDLGTLLQQLSKLLAEFINADSCFIYLLSDTKIDLVLLGAYPPHPTQIGKVRLETGQGITGWVAAHQEPAVLCGNAYKDPRFKFVKNIPEDKYEALLSVPIILDSNPTGVINIFNKKSTKFTASHVDILTNIATHIASAIEKMRLEQVANNKEKQIEVIAKLSTTIVSGMYLKEILQLIVTMTAQMMNSKICSLMLLNEKTGELKIEATQSLSDEYKTKPPINIAKSLAGKSIIEKRSIVVVDVTNDPNYTYPEIAKKEGLCSMLAVPMMFKNKPIGVINCYTTVERNFSLDEISLLSTIANQAAIAIENTRLIEEANVTKEALETRKLIDRAKGILMRSKNMNEEEAFRFLQRQAMDLRRTMKDIAEAVLLSEGIRKANP